MKWTDQDGEDVGVTPGQTHTLKTEIQMNMRGQANGIPRSWLDDLLMLECDEMRLTATTNLGIDNFFFSSFHGGTAAGWAPDNESYI